ncbi:MAG: BamA/TamA family outer membrane protein, partial [Planctomycetota bacterium]
SLVLVDAPAAAQNGGWNVGKRPAQVTDLTRGAQTPQARIAQIPGTSPSFPPNQPIQPNPGLQPSPGLSTPAFVPLGNGASVGTNVGPNVGVFPTNPTYQPNYPQTLAPGATGVYPPGFLNQSGQGFLNQPNAGLFNQGTLPPFGGNNANERIAPIDVYLSERRTGRIIFGGTVNSDLGTAGKLIIEEHNFDWRQLTPGRNFLQTGGQHLRIEAMPGNEVQRYMASWTQPNLRGYLPYSLSLGGFYYTRAFRDWHEQRGGGRVALGYKDNRSFSISSELRMEDVKLFRPRVDGFAPLEAALGSNDIYRARFRMARDTRDSPFISSDGGLLEFVFDQVFGEYDYPRGQVTWLRHWPIGVGLDPNNGRRTLSHSLKLGITGSQTPIFENFYAGGFSTLRGFDFRAASPRVNDVEVGGELSVLGSLEYAIPITADDMLRGVAFMDYGVIEEDIEFDSDNVRLSLGLGLRVSVPFVSPAPFAFDFAYPVLMADTDERRIFSFYVGATR